MQNIRFIILTLTVLVGCSDSEQINIVKKGTLNSCPNTTLEKMVDGFMKSPSWESGEGDNGQVFVNVKGGVSIKDKEVNAVIQFLVNKDNKSFQFQGLELNDVPQINLMAMGLLSKMCDESKNN